MEDTENKQADLPADPNPAPAAVETPEQPEHPVTVAVKEHLSEKIGAALASIPAKIEHDFAAALEWVKAAI